MTSQLFTEHVQRPRNIGPLLTANSIGRYGTVGGGPYMIFWLVLQGNKIAKATFDTYGCPAAVACGSLTTELITGRTVEEALKLEPEDLILVLGGVPEGREECARFAVIALRDALGGNIDAV